jgi:NADH:ubiquinone oxidoreductase subunit E
MMIQNITTESVKNSVNAAINQYGDSRAELIPILNHVNQSLGYLPPEALEEISFRLKSPRASLFGVASFYHMLSTTPRGKHVIQFCESAPCHVVGGREIWQTLKTELKLDNGETSDDGNWSLITTSCLGLCAVGPVIVIDEDVYGNVTADQVADILNRYKD